jgi:hypothetical protein
LELTCAIDQVTLLTKGHIVGGVRKTEDRVWWCDLDYALHRISKRGALVRPTGERDTGWTWSRQGETENVLLLPRVPRRGHAFALETRDWMMLIAPYRSVIPRITIQARSHFLLSVGPASALAAIKEWTAENIIPLVNGTVPGKDPTWKISRIDIAADLAGIELEASDLSDFTSRAKFKREHHGPEKATGNHRGRRFTGFEFGKRGSPMYARIYNKSIEADDDAPVRGVWSEAGYRPDQHGETVWRIEFEVRASLLRDLVRSDDSRLNENLERTVKEDLGSIWKFATGKWLILRSREDVTRIERRAVRDWWKALGHLDFRLMNSSKGVPLKRKPALGKKADVFLRASLGSLASFAALESVPDLACAMGRLERLAQGKDDGLDFVEMVARSQIKREGQRASAKEVERRIKKLKMLSALRRKKSWYVYRKHATFESPPRGPFLQWHLPLHKPKGEGNGTSGASGSA